MPDSTVRGAFSTVIDWNSKLPNGGLVLHLSEVGKVWWWNRIVRYPYWFYFLAFVSPGEWPFECTLVIWFFVLIEKTSSLGLPKRSNNACCVAHPFGSQQGWMQKDSSKIGYALHFWCFIPQWYFSLFVWIMAICMDDISLFALEILCRGIVPSYSLLFPQCLS